MFHAPTTIQLVVLAIDAQRVATWHGATVNVQTTITPKNASLGFNLGSVHNVESQQGVLLLSRSDNDTMSAMILIYFTLGW